MSVQRTPEGDFAAIGSNGFYSRGGSPAAFAQQPVEACGAAAACLEAHRATGDPVWAEHALRAFNWFLGQNHLHQWLYDAATGGRRDGLHADRVNRTQGAEATLSFLLALHDVRAHDRLIVRPAPVPAEPAPTGPAVSMPRVGGGPPRRRATTLLETSAWNVDSAVPCRAVALSGHHQCKTPTTPI